MKWICFLLFFISAEAFAQTDSVEMPNKEYIQMIVHPYSGFSNTSYNYSGKWDFDGDGKKDSLYFIGNGGVHTYFFPRLVLSSDNKKRDFQYLEIDMPYFVENKDALKNNNGENVPQLVVYDFDMDGISEIYLNIYQPYYKTPKTLHRLGLKGPKILFDYSKNKLLLKDYVLVE